MLFNNQYNDNYYQCQLTIIPSTLYSLRFDNWLFHTLEEEMRTKSASNPKAFDPYNQKEIDLILSLVPNKRNTHQYDCQYSKVQRKIVDRRRLVPHTANRKGGGRSPPFRMVSYY